ncbi:MAG: 50S ribosomal protein L25 [Solirubrobacterales bacterium]|nr:50S ribosomal protein L25 [Solirubrobacterales bacterium]
MAKATTTTIEAEHRDPDGSRSARRLRRDGIVPGVVYGGEGEPESLQVDERALRAALGGHSALYELKIGSDTPQPVLVREFQRHPVSGRIVHIDLIRVDLNKKVQATVPIEVTGAEDSPGIKFGGLLEQIIREANIEALPTAIPEMLSVDASKLEIGDGIHISDLVAPEGVELLDDPELVVATVVASRMAQQVERDLEEAEAEVIGEEGEEGAEGEDASDGEASGGDAGDSE